MTNDEKKTLAKTAGLSYVGNNEDGDPEFLGNDSQWKEFEVLQDKLEKNYND